MEKWITFIIPLIALVVWIVANLVRVPNQPPNQARRPQPRPRPSLPEQSPQEKPISDLDRFLQEVQRRREQSESQQTARRAAPPPLPAAVVPAPPRLCPPPLPRVMLAPAAPAPALQASGLSPLPQVRPPRPAETRPLTKEENAERQAAARVQEAAAGEQLQLAAYAQVRRKPSRGLVSGQLAEMLRNRRSLRAAFVLREILDQPLCRRRPRRHV